MPEIADWEEYAPGRWRPSVPLPFYCLIYVRCACGKRFWGLADPGGTAEQRYRIHYRAEHIPPGRETR